MIAFDALVKLWTGWASPVLLEGPKGMVMIRHAATALGLLLGTSGALHAAEWRYCFTISPDGRRFYMSTPFTTSEAPAVMEREYVRYLGSQRVDGNRPACPRALDRETLAAMMRTAIQYNRQNGTTAVPLGWPGNAVAGP